MESYEKSLEETLEEFKERFKDEDEELRMAEYYSEELETMPEEIQYLGAALALSTMESGDIHNEDLNAFSYLYLIQGMETIMPLMPSSYMKGTDDIDDIGIYFEHMCLGNPQIHIRAEKDGSTWNTIRMHPDDLNAYTIGMLALPILVYANKPQINFQWRHEKKRSIDNSLTDKERWESGKMSRMFSVLDMGLQYLGGFAGVHNKIPRPDTLGLNMRLKEDENSLPKIEGNRNYNPKTVRGAAYVFADKLWNEGQNDAITYFLSLELNDMLIETARRLPEKYNS